MYIGRLSVGQNQFQTNAAKAGMNILSRLPAGRKKNTAALPPASAPGMKARLRELSAQMNRMYEEGARNAENSALLRLGGKTDWDSYFDYTKDNAVNRAWDAAQPPLKLDLESLKGRGGMQKIEGFENWHPAITQSAETLRAFEAELRAGGGAREMNWDGLAADLRRGTLGVSGSVTGGDELGARTDYLASRFAAAEAKITANTAGTEREEQLSRLRAMMEEAVSKTADNYANAVGAILEENGVGGETENIRASVLEAIGARTDAYRAALGQNDALAALRGTADEWLLQDDAYVAATLRKTAKIAAPESETAPYTLDDLTALSAVAGELRAAGAHSAFSTDEERFGLQLAMFSMKLDTLGKSGNVSGALAATLRRVTDSYVGKAVDRYAQSVDERRNNPLTAYDARGFTAVNKDAVMRVYDRTMAFYRDRAGGDAMDALRRGAAFALAQHAQNQREMDGVYRYGSDRYWTRFFEPDEKADAAAWYAPYGTTYGRYAAGWEDFLGSLGSGETPRLNAVLRSAESYGLGNLVDLLA